jgi:NAD(P)H-flavin reductase
MDAKRQSLLCRLAAKRQISADITRLDFEWRGSPPRAGQFFMVKPRRSAVFLARPLSVAGTEDGTVIFVVARRGAGTAELASMGAGEAALLTGPLGNCWADFAIHDAKKTVALLAGGVGIAPLAALISESVRRNSLKFDVLAGFRRGADGEALFSALGIGAGEALIVNEDAGEDDTAPTSVKRRLVTDFLDAGKYAAVFACGPAAMLKAAAALCRTSGVPCFVSLENRMACGTGACLGCTVRTRSGGKRCCADGPIFDAGEVFFDD